MPTDAVWDGDADAFERRWRLGIYSRRASVMALAVWAWLWLLLSIGGMWLFLWGSFFFFIALTVPLIALATLPSLMAIAASSEVIWRGVREGRRHAAAVASASLTLALAVIVPIIGWSHAL